MDLTKAETLARQLMDQHELKDWSILYDKKSRRLGACNYQFKTIFLSTHWTTENDEKMVTDTILHEIAHALVGPGHGHDVYWSIKARNIGAKPYSCMDNFEGSRKIIEAATQETFQKWMCKNCKVEKIIIKTVPLGENLILRLECEHFVKIKPEDLIPKTPTHGWTLHSRDGKTLRPYQLAGIDLIKTSGFKALIGDEPGVGKTAQAIGALVKYPEDLLPALYLGKSSIKIQVAKQFINWAGFEFIPQIIEDSKIPPVEGFNVYIASYDILRRFGGKEKVTNKYGNEVEKRVSPFYSFPFKSIILDEVQAIKGDSQRTREVERICEGKNVIALSGTAVNNNADEYFPILHILHPELFPDRTLYRNVWVDMEQTKSGAIRFKGIKSPERFKEKTKHFIIRRALHDIAPEVPKINRQFFHVDFENEKMRDKYHAAEFDFIKAMEKERKDRAASSIDILALISNLRHVIGLSKIPAVVERTIEHLEDTDRPIMIFLHHIDVADATNMLLQKYCLENDMALPLVYHSSLSAQARENIKMKFIAGESRVMIASTLASGEGVDGLQEICCDMILGERQWNPAKEQQVERRFERIGQKYSFINSIYPIVTGTIDEKFCELIENKRRNLVTTLDGREIEWDEVSLLNELYDVLMTKGRSSVVTW